MPTLTIDKIQLPSGNTYELRDADAQGKLVNVYDKSETYTKAEVQAAIADAMKGGYLAVSELPAASENTMGHIYLVPDSSGSGDNVKIEYVTIRSGSEGAYTYTWEKLGTTKINLDNLELEKGSGDMVLGEGTTFTVSKPGIDITGGTTDKVLGSDATFATNVTPARTALRVVQEADGLNSFVRSYPGETSKLETDTVPNVTSAGSASTWAFQMGTGNDSTTLIISGANGAAPTLGTAKTVATGSLTSGGSGASVMTGLGSPTVANAVVAVGAATLESSDSNVDAAGYVTVVKGITSASTTADNKDEVTAVTGVGTAALASNPTVTVGTNDKVKVAKYDDLELQKP